MAKVRLDVDTNFDEASKEAREFGTVIDKESEKYAELVQKYDDTAIDGLIERHRRLASAIHATNGPQQAAIVQQRELAKTIKKLILDGLDPQGDELSALRTEYARVTATVNDNIQAEQELTRRRREATEAARRQAREVAEESQITADIRAKSAEVYQRSLMGIVGAVGIVSAAIVKNSFAVAENGDAYLRSANKIGVTVEEFQELESVFVKMGGTQDRFGDAMDDMTEKIGDARLGAGSLNAHLSDTNPILLQQLKNTTSTMEAFNLLTEEMASTTNEQDRMILATELFADAGKDMISMTALGVDGIKELREEAREYGIMTNDAAEESARFVQSQRDLSAAVQGVKNRFGADLIPILNLAVQSATDFIGSLSEDDLNDISESIIFIAKGFTLVGVAVNSVSALVMAAGDIFKSIPDAIGHAFSMTIVGVSNAITEISNLINNSKIKEVVEKALNIEIPEIDTTAFENAAEQAGFAAEEFAFGMSEGMSAAGDRITNMDQLNDGLMEFVKNGRVAVDTVREIDSAVAGTNASALVPVVSAAVKDEKDGGNKSTEIERLRENLRILTDAEKSANAERVAEYEQFYALRLEQDSAASAVSFETADQEYQAKFDALQESYALIAELDSTTAEQKIAAEIALNARLEELGAERTKSQKEESEARLDIATQMVSSLGGLFGSLANVQKNLGKESRALLVTEKVLAVAEIGINTQRGVMAEWAKPLPVAVKAINAGIVGLAGGAAAVKVATTPIPSAETGVTEFIAPQSQNGRVDGVNLRVNDDEKVTVTPRSEESSSSRITVNLILDREVVQTIVQDALDDNILQISSDNIQQVA